MPYLLGTGNTTIGHAVFIGYGYDKACLNEYNDKACLIGYGYDKACLNGESPSWGFPCWDTINSPKRVKAGTR